MIAALLLLLSAPPADRCEKAWAQAVAPPAAEARGCLRYVLTLAYGRAVTPDDLDLDPPRGTAEALRFGAARLRELAQQVRALCADGCTDVSKDPEPARAAEWLEAEAEARFTLFDADLMGSIEAPLAAVLAGRAITVESAWTPLTLWKLRNAVFARHGKRFESPDLTRFFYGPDAVKVQGRPPLAVSAEPWSDAKLDAVDKRTIAALVVAEKKRARR